MLSFSQAKHDSSASVHGHGARGLSQASVAHTFAQRNGPNLQTASAGRLDSRLAVVTLAFVLVIGLVLRWLFAQHAPVLVLGDSETYLGPAVALEGGAGFDLLPKRTPGYPLLIAASLTLFGESLRALAAIQHGLGLMTAALAFCMASRVAGLTAGALAGLAVALLGNLLVYERLVMSEALFTALLAAAVAALIAATERPRMGWLLAAGIMIGAATLVRPVAQALLLLAPLALLLSGQRWTRFVLGLAVVVVGYGLIVGPWVVSGVVFSEDGSIGALGQTLVGRTARHDRRDPTTDTGFVFFDPTHDVNSWDPVRLAAAQILQEAANRGSSGRAVHTRLKRELDLSDAEADRLMRDLAVEAILRRPEYYLGGTAQRFVRLWNTPAERLNATWNEQAAVRREWEHGPSASLLEQTGPSHDLPLAEALTRVFQPAYLGWGLPALFLLGAVTGLARRRYRTVLIPACAVVLLLTLSAALVGGVPRYRYPLDPLIFVVATVGLAGGASALRDKFARRPTT